MLFRLFTTAANTAIECGDSPIELQWINFFMSSRVLVRLCADASGISQEDRPSLGCWLTEINRGCDLWLVLSQHNMATSDLDAQEQAEMWDTISFLIKGAFYEANNILPSRLAMETNDHFLLHAAVGILPRCAQNGNGNVEAISTVLDRILKLHPDQLFQSGPVMDRMPLHIAATNKGSLIVNAQNPPSKIDAPRQFNVEVLEKILDKSPISVVSTPDINGFCPFHLACANGYSWTSGLELLFSADPKVGIKASSVPSLLVLIAGSTVKCDNEAASKKTFKAKRKIMRSWMQKRMFFHKGKLADDESSVTTMASEIDAVDTIYQLLSTDPSAALEYVNIKSQ